MKKSFLLIFTFLFFLQSCIVFKTVDVRTESKHEVTVSPVKVHLKDGRNVIFRDGVRFQDDRLYGHGVVYMLDLTYEDYIEYVEIHDVAAFEVFSPKTLIAPTLLVNTALTAVTVLGSVVIFKAIFGSCPTVYHTAGTDTTLQAELFSNSIAPMLEMRDVARLKAKPDESGILSLEIRNEALETHYINHLEILEIVHEQSEYIVPSNYHRPLTLDKFIVPDRAVNSLGIDIRNKLNPGSDQFYSSPEPVYTTGDQDILWDHIELSFASPGSADAALHLNVRNTLYSTVLLYDFMIAARGWGALDWLGRDLSTVSEAVALGDFSQQYLGIHIDQKVDGEYEEIGRIQNVGPISWKDIALELNDISMEDSLHVRLRFLHDSWHISQARLATSVKPSEYRRIPASEIRSSGETISNEVLEGINHVNADYFITTPATRFYIDFDTRPVSADIQSTYFISAQGYYLEWIRPEWLEAPPYTEYPDYSPGMVYRSQKQWFEVKDEFEKQFFETKIPVQ
jgi:hypothetical protein